MLLLAQVGNLGAKGWNVWLLPSGAGEEALAEYVKGMGTLGVGSGYVSDEASVDMGCPDLEEAVVPKETEALLSGF